MFGEAAKITFKSDSFPEETAEKLKFKMVNLSSYFHYLSWKLEQIYGRYFPPHPWLGSWQDLPKYSTDNVAANKKPKIMKTIDQINFVSLTWITLRKNSIESIEGFSRTQMPLIRTIYVGTNFLNWDDNKITKCSDFRKGAWPELSSLGICI